MTSLLGYCLLEDSRSYLRELCDRYFDPGNNVPGTGSTQFYMDGIEYFNDMAKLALKFYNDKEQENFYLEKVGKLNIFVTDYCLTFWARTSESEVVRLFRGVVRLMGEHKVLLCEIKSSLIGLCVKYTRIHEHVGNDLVGGSIDASVGAAIGLVDIDLSSGEGFCPMGHSMFGALRDLCDTHFNWFDCGARITFIDVDGNERVKNLVSLALKFYNKKKQKNFYLKEVVKLNIFLSYHCLTFSAQTANSDECHLFRAALHVMGITRVVLCEIKDDSEIMIPVDHSESFGLKHSRNDDQRENDTSGALTDASLCSDVCHGFLGLDKADGFFIWTDSVLPLLRELCDGFFDTRDHNTAAGVTRFDVDGFSYVKLLAESALMSYNEKEQKNLYVEIVGKLNLFLSYYCLTFWARSAESDVRHLFRGVVDVMNGFNVMLCEIKDGDEITNPVDNSENFRPIGPRVTSTRIYNFHTNDSACGLVDASSGAGVGRGVVLGKVDGYCLLEGSRAYLRELCDRYFDPGNNVPGAGSTRYYMDDIEYFNDMAELALKFYNEKEQENFYLEKVGKLNIFVTDYCLTFWARTSESEVVHLFRGVVRLMGEHKVLLCEIKDDGEFTIPDGYSENRRLKRPRIYECPK